MVSLAREVWDTDLRDDHTVLLHVTGIHATAGKSQS